MSNEKDGKGSQPPEARRRGGMDTLFSAAWFDEEAAAKAKAQSTPGGAERAEGPDGAVDEPAPQKSKTVLFVGIGLVAALLIGGVLCAGILGGAGAWYYASSAG
jgi:hypothetical protein